MQFRVTAKSDFVFGLFEFVEESEYGSTVLELTLTEFLLLVIGVVADQKLLVLFDIVPNLPQRIPV